MKLLITGNMGYVGPWVTRKFRKEMPDSTLLGIDMGYFATCTTNADILPECRLDIQYFGDIRSLPAALLKDVDVIIHLAAISNDPIGNSFEQATHAINYKASVELARKAKAAGVKKFVYASSCSMYGAAEEKPKDEDSAVNPLTAYAKSKINTENDLKQIADKNFHVTSLRFSTACGMSDRLRLDLVLNDFVACAITSRKITILSDGTPWRPLINVEDMARAIHWASIRDDGVPFIAVNVGSNQWNYQVKDLAEAVANVFGNVEVEINKNAQPDKRSYRVNFDLFEKLAPDFQPLISLERSIVDLKTGMEAMQFSDADFRNSQYIRLKKLTSLTAAGLLDENLCWVTDPV